MHLAIGHTTTIMPGIPTSSYSNGHRCHRILNSSGLSTRRSGSRGNSRRRVELEGKLCTCFGASQRACRLRARGYRVEIQHDSGTAILDVDEGDTILQAALDSGLKLSHDCKAGVCMTCPAKLLEGEVDQSAGMLDDGAKEKGYALLCISEPRSDCRIQIIDEDEILEEVLCSSG